MAELPIHNWGWAYMLKVCVLLFKLCFI